MTNSRFLSVLSLGVFAAGLVAHRSPALATVQPDKAKTLAREAVNAAGGPKRLLKIFRWKETYWVGETGPSTPREAIIFPPNVWIQDGVNIAEGNADRTEKTYMVWTWTLAPLLEKDTTLTYLPPEMFRGKLVEGLRIQRKDQKDISLFFDSKTKRLARMDWREYIIDFEDWRETDGFKYPAKAFVRKKDGSLYLRNEFIVLERLQKLPESPKPGESKKP